MDIKIRMGIALRHFREKNGLSQKQLSDLTGMDRTFISHIESGARNISIETLETMLQGLGVTLAGFFRHEIFVRE